MRIRRLRQTHLLLLSFVLLQCALAQDPQHEQRYTVEEGVAVGTIVGNIASNEGGGGQVPGPPYIIVPVTVPEFDTDLDVDPDTGLIRTKSELDRERVSEYHFSAIPLSSSTSNSESVSVTVSVSDVNDHAPEFPGNGAPIEVNVPEHIPVGTRRKLVGAVDRDGEQFGIRSYDIVSGNEDGSFTVQAGRQRHTPLDLIVNADLDREKADSYTLEVVAVDGGQPPKTGTLTVRVNVQDLNDNPPIFTKQRYFTTVQDNLPLGSEVVQVHANDADAGSNGRVSYSINRRQSDQEGFFRIDAQSGTVILDKRLDFERQKVHELVVVATDGGDVPLDTSAFVTVRLSPSYDKTSSDNELNQPTHTPLEAIVPRSSMKILFVNGRDSVHESTKVGDPFAQLFLSNPSETGIQGLNFQLSDDRTFQVRKNTSGVFLSTRIPLDYDKQKIYHLTVEAVDPENPGRYFHDTFDIRVENSNDNAPKFEKSQYSATVEESAAPGSLVTLVRAFDPDEGESGQISYSIVYEGTSRSDWFTIDETTGQITTQTFVDCETDSHPMITIMARDNGNPRLSSSASVTISVTDVNDNKPIFTQTTYDATLKEDKEVGDCFLKVQAEDMDCGRNSEIEYRIKETNIDQFKIDEKNGELCLAKSLDHEQQDFYRFTVIATDKGGLSTSTMVKIEVLDVNDNAPEFQPINYIAKIRRRFPVSTLPIVTVFAQDEDSGPAGLIEYSITNGNSDNVFSIDSNRGDIYLAKELNPESDGRTYNLRVIAVDGEGQVSPLPAQVSITIDDNDVSFDKPQYVFETTESISPYTNVGTVKSSRLGLLEIYESNVHGSVSIDPRSGEIRTESRLDHETHPVIVLNIKLKSDLFGKESYCQVILTVEDVNDNAPDFGLTVAMASIKEDFRVGEVVYKAQAKDSDSGDNGRFHYFLGPAGQSVFGIESDTGNIVLLEPLDYEDKESYQLSIDARDMGTPALNTTLKLTIQVHDVNDNAPIFDKDHYEFTISETQVVNAPIASIFAKDIDSGKNGQIMYEISENPYVMILKNSGVLVLKKAIDQEERKYLELDVIASDKGTPPMKSLAKLTLRIADKNNNSPEFEKKQYSFHVKENEPSETFVGSVRAYDGDNGLNGEIEYSFKVPVREFRIDSLSGIITTATYLDREEAEVYEVIVEATDKGQIPRSSEVVVTVVIQDVNDNAPVLLEPTDGVLYVQRNSPVGSVVGRLYAEDPDSSVEKISFEAIDSSQISVASNGDILLLKNIQSPEELNEIRVRLTDSTEPKQSRVELLKIIFVDDLRSFRKEHQRSKALSVSPDSKVGELIGNVALSGHRFWYSLASKRKLFSLDASNGDLFLAKNLDGETDGTSFTFEVIATSVNGERGDTAINVTVTIENSDERPEFRRTPINLALKENVNVGASVLNLFDFSNEAIKTFEIVEQVPSSSFKIHGNQLVLSHQLDFERVQEMLVLVRGYSEGRSLSAEVPVIVEITDVNDNAPVFISSNDINFPQDVPAGSTIFKFLVVDIDSGRNGEHDLSIVNGNEDETFKLRGDFLELNENPRLSSYDVIVRATDKGIPQLSTDQTVRIKFGQSSNHGTRFKQNTFAADIEENLPPHQHVIKVTMNNNDVPVKFTLMKGQQFFYVDEDTGDIKTVEELDREEYKSHSLVVVAKSSYSGEVLDTAIVTVRVKDVNDNPPVFGRSCRDISIPENSHHSFIHAFIAHDDDSGENSRISYTLQDDQREFSNKFRIERDTGKFHAQPLDREEKSEYHISILAVDNGPERHTAKCDVLIKVLDLNDNQPSFSQQIYSASVREDIELGTEVLRVSAVDMDEGDNANLHFTIEKATASAFAIDHRTGAIVNTVHLDREVADEYRFDVVVIDDAKDSSQSSRTQVRIIVTDANDHVPQFSMFPFRVNISSNMDPTVPIARLFAFDPDSGPNGQLTFNIINPEQRAKFEVSPDDGILTLATGGISLEPGTTETVQVTVSDAGSPPKSSTGLVEILVDGGPTTKLLFPNSLYEVTLSENPESGTDLLEVRAVRSDGSRQKVIYEIVSGNQENSFEINSNNGLIRVRDPLAIDYEKVQDMNLTIMARGLEDDSLRAYVTCHVIITDVNDNSPKFTEEVYKAKIKEGNRRGSFVTQIIATDTDSGDNGRIKFEIIGGNLDNSFYLDAENPGVLRTNAVLDREIKDYYELTVSAKDQGSPSLVALAQVIVQVVDLNDNPPNFAQVGVLTVSKNSQAGSIVASLRANDIDLSPVISYRLDKPNEFISINTFDGQLLLLKEPRKDEEKVFKLTAIASDELHEAKSQIEVRFTEDDDNCELEFSQPLYSFVKSRNDSIPSAIGDVKVKDCYDRTDDLIYELTSFEQTSVNVLTNGTIVLNRSPSNDIITVGVRVKDTFSFKSTDAVVTVHMVSDAIQSLEFEKSLGDAIVDEDTPPVLKAKPLKKILAEGNHSGLFYSLSGNNAFSIDSYSGQIFRLPQNTAEQSSVLSQVTISVRQVGTGKEKSKLLKIIATPKDSSSIRDNPRFLEDHLNVTLKDSSEIGTELRLCKTSSSQGNPFIKIISGNVGNTFALDSKRMKLKLSKNLDSSRRQYRVMLKMGTKTFFSLCKVTIIVTETRLKDTVFPLSSFSTTCEENSPVNTILPGPPISHPTTNINFWTDSVFFNIDSRTGSIATRSVFDYEEKTSYQLTIFANGSSTEECFVDVKIQSQDEFPPEFEQSVYYFTISGQSDVGDVIGRIRAQDRDSGPDGFIQYQLATPTTYFSVDPTQGLVTLSKSLDTGVFEASVPEGVNDVLRRKRSLKDVRLVVKASSRQANSLESSSVIVISIEVDNLPLAVTASSGMATWVTAVLISFVLILIALAFGIVFFCKRRLEQERKAKKNSFGALETHPANMSMELKGSEGGNSGHITRLPPQYSDIMSDYGPSSGHGKFPLGSENNNPLRASNVSEKSHRSASSGRGSVEDVDDEVDSEIRMINEGNFFANSNTGFVPDTAEEEDKQSENSVQNTDEYLARLGIDIRKPPNISGEMLHNFDNYTNTSSIYNRIADDMSEKTSVRSGRQSGSVVYGVNQVRGATVSNRHSLAGSLSSIVHSEEELGGSYNWDYLLDWGPQYQPLAHVFKEISKLKDDDHGSETGAQSSKSFAQRSNVSAGAAGTSSALSATGGLPFVSRNPHTSHLLASRSARSPISHDLGQNALSPSFHPALSPLATKSPSISPLSVPMKRNMPNQRL